MYKIKPICIPLLIVALNAGLVIVSFIITYLIRYGGSLPTFTFTPFKETFFILTFLYALAFGFSGLYESRFRSHWELTRKVFMGIVIGTLFSFVFLYVFRAKWKHFPSSILLLIIPIGTVLVVFGDIIMLRLLGCLKTHLVIVGATKEKDLVLVKRSRLQIHHANHIEDILRLDEVDEILICEYILDDLQFNLLIYLLNKLKINVNFSPTLYAKLLSGNINKDNKLAFFATTLGRKSDMEEFLIGLLDISASLALLVVLLPLMLVVSILIKLTSAGPVFYRQERVGKDGKLFTLLKFRTMINHAETETGPVLATRSDPRVTGLGRFLRKTRLDELPQLFNVLMGQMSLVGPRPERFHFVKIHNVLQGVRLAVKPGITGLAQVSNFYDLHPRHKIKYDYLYIQRRSFLLNAYILIRTIPAIFIKQGW